MTARSHSPQDPEEWATVIYLSDRLFIIYEPGRDREDAAGIGSDVLAHGFRDVPFEKSGPMTLWPSSSIEKVSIRRVRDLFGNQKPMSGYYARRRESGEHSKLAEKAEINLPS